jgi:uncharacterized protein YndB with AHSA1/START domain
MNTTTHQSEAPLSESAGAKVIAERIINAPRELVFKAWTDPEQVKHWWGPKDHTAPVAKADLRVGGKYHYAMRSPDGQDFWTTGVYKEFAPPERVVYTDAFADAEGNEVPASHYGMPGDWPVFTMTVTFEDLGGKTKVTVRQAGAVPAEAQGDAELGYNQMFDKFVAYVTGA